MLKQKGCLGIDPGTNGAMALLPTDDLPLVEDWPGDPGAVVNILSEWIREFEIVLCALESVHAMPKQGVSSTFRFGQNLGQWQGILSAFGLPYLMPKPQQWQKGLFIKSDGPDPKSRSLACARRLFPEAELTRKRDHGRADALLLGWWARQQARK